MSDPSEKMPVHKSEMWSQEIWLPKINKSDLAICLQKGGETGGWESEGRSDQVKFFKLFQNGRIGSPYMTESNSVELFNVEFFLTEKLTLKAVYPESWNTTFLGVRSPVWLTKVRRGPCLKFTHFNILKFTFFCLILIPRQVEYLLSTSRNKVSKGVKSFDYFNFLMLLSKQ